ncbi:MAG: hypothetical protein A2827_03335 [Candidatus Spechtbacteria bacterium RIFCSPHIGHO2_01_FULL_43_30]|uniref:DUF4129 domain-containing protein n=1 Tax=Candidatus Spechtbacteria bacterium RIFCSPHIGHO2_01_FULL_43_30 TaxID=1802158 RepID=A0A1G2H8I8_9BACT|nr:MAG: hypothetical protein A2827_03335 [Candidatus Spechtbacteria bacterium RIFCSPHIGHO2_01_FULL_43_30]
MSPEQEIQLILNNPAYFFESTIFVIFQVLSGIVSLFFLVSTVILLKRGGGMQRHLRHLIRAWNASYIPMKKMTKRWMLIERSLESGDSLRWKAAIIDADNMLDEILKKVGYLGDTMDKRLENVHLDQFPTLEDAWRAHKVRKFLEEDPRYKPSKEVVARVFEIYKDIFRETGLTL